VSQAPKAYSYIRFSTPEQQSGDSFRRQFDLSRTYAELHGLDLDANLTYRDLGVSAFDKSNLRSGQLGTFLKAIESGAVASGSYLLVESLDRISRAQITDALEIFMSIINNGITIVTLADGMEYSKEKANERFADIMISIAIMSRAHEESLTKSKRLKEAWRSKRTRLDVRKLTTIAPAWLTLDADKTTYLPVPDRVLLVQNIFAWSKDGIGSETIARRLNQQGVPTFGARAKNQWHSSYIKKILDNRAVLGEFQPHVLISGKRLPEGDRVTDYFPPIVSNEDFMLAMTARQSRRTNSAGRKGLSISNLFSGILTCGYCKGSMVYVNKGHNGPRAKLLVCSNAKAGKDCHYIPWEYAYFEKSVLTYCKGLDLDSFLQPREGIKSEMAVLSSRVAVLQASIAQNESRRSNILEAIEAGAKYQQFKARATQLEQEREKLDSELDATKKAHEQQANAQIDIHAVRASIDGLLQKLGELTGDELYDLRAMLSQHVKRLITRIAIYPGGYIEKESFVARLRDHLINAGHDAAMVDDYIAGKSNMAPDVSQRFFTMVSRSAAVRIIRPDFENPEVLRMDVPNDDTKNNMALHAATLSTILETLGEAASKLSGRGKTSTFP
jgi:DNA invertase Pin-like site-specific DNA recombinase